MNKVRDNDTVVVLGETGSGKTTRELGFSLSLFIQRLEIGGGKRRNRKRNEEANIIS